MTPSSSASTKLYKLYHANPRRKNLVLARASLSIISTRTVASILFAISRNAEEMDPKRLSA
jgi:hypothetical protein